jgi:hypothetical protein
MMEDDFNIDDTSNGSSLDISEETVKFEEKVNNEHDKI